MLLTDIDLRHCLACCADQRATDEEREFLAYAASLAAAQMNARVQLPCISVHFRRSPVRDR